MAGSLDPSAVISGSESSQPKRAEDRRWRPPPRPDGRVEVAISWRATGVDSRLRGVISDLEVGSAARHDRNAIRHLVQQAFTADGRDGREELDIVESIWRLDAACDHLELVATVEGIVSGYVLGSWGDLEGRPVVGIAPLAVTPALQRRGVGTALMEELIARAERSRLPLLVLLGSPDYYVRFGFESSVPLDVHYGPAGPQSPYFLVRRLRTYTAMFRGAYRYAWETGGGY